MFCACMGLMSRRLNLLYGFPLASIDSWNIHEYPGCKVEVFRPAKRRHAGISVKKTAKNRAMDWIRWGRGIPGWLHCNVQRALMITRNLLKPWSLTSGIRALFLNTVSS